MNLHAVANSAIRAVNPNVPATLRVSAGYATAPDGAQVPAYVAQAVRAQVQALTYKDLVQVSGLNLNGSKCAIYLYGVANGVVRVTAKGGDLLVIASGVYAGTWLIAQNLEQWPDWCKVAATLQDGS